jgi:diaminopimelate decarboxylase
MSIDYKNLSTPCYLINLDILCDVIKGIKNAINNFFAGAIVSYSVKSNYHPYILNFIKDSGVWLEVSSEDEYSMLREIGGNVNIIYNGPTKSKESFLEAIERGNIVNIDSFTEIDWLDSLKKEKKYRVGIRVNYNLSLYSKEYKECKSSSRFGFSIENNSFEEAVEKIRRYGNIRINVLHMHRGGTTKSYETYRAITEIACKIIKKYQLEIDYIDIGGGFRLGVSNDLVIEKYMETIRNELKKYNMDKRIKMIFEIGNSIIYPCVDYVTKVYGKKEVDGLLYVTLDGSRIHTDPLFNRKKYMGIICIGANTKGAGHSTNRKQVLCGCTCKEMDRFDEVEVPELLAGDIVIFKEIGAYTMSLCPSFIRSFPCVYVYQYGKIKMYSKKKQLNELQIQ